MKRIALLFAAVLTMLLMNGLVFAQDTTLTITGNGNVGIGTTNPSEKVQLNGFNQPGPVYLKLATNGVNEPPTGLKFSGIKLKHFSDDYGFTLESIDEAGASAGAFQIKSHLGDSAGTIRLFIHRGTGNVGIGTTTPSQKLQVLNGNILAGDATGSGGSLYFGNTSHGIQRGAPNGNFINIFTAGGAESGFAFTHATAGEVLRITSIGNVGIGTANPTARFHVVGSGTASSGSTIATFADINSAERVSIKDEQGSNPPGISSSTGNGLGLYATLASVRFYTGGSQRMQIDNAGRVGVGTMSPDQLLSVNGDASKVGGGSWATFSDRRVKQDINTFTDGLSVVKGIRPVTFRYNGKLGYPTDKTYVGVIAQEIQSVAPYTVDSYRAKLNSDDAEETDILRFDGTALIYIAINAIKELDAKVEEMRELQKENRNLSNRLAELEALVKSLAAEKKNVDGKSLGELR